MKAARLIGGAGTGKTTELMAIMDKLLAREIGPLEVGFCSFTRAARREAATRAGDRFGVPVPVLEREGWFRTIHSVAYNVLGIGAELLAGDSAKTREWFRETFDEDVIMEDSDGFAEPSRGSEIETILSIWGAARSRLVSLADQWEMVNAVDSSIPDLDDCRSVVDHYELAKRVDGRVDFADILARFAGREFRLDGPLEISPDGEVPDVPVWIFDEQQDVTPLLDLVARRLASGPSTRYVYLAGDPFQSIYGFAGADGSLFMDWDVHQERTMDRSFRCPADILEMGEAVLSGCSNYFDRGILPADHQGEVCESWLPDLGDLDPSVETLVIARTNYIARTVASQLTARGIPWSSTRGSGGWLSAKKREAMVSLGKLSDGEAIKLDGWKRILEMIPARDYLERGVKKRFLLDKEEPEGDAVSLWNLGTWGATPELVDRIARDGWVSLVEGGDLFVRAVSRYGYKDALGTRIRVGTIHSVKGLEADNVTLISESSRRCSESERTPWGADEERRVAYVGITRASQNLTITRPTGSLDYEIPIPGTRRHAATL